MKKLLLLLILPFFVLGLNAQCDYEVELWDSWGDAWNGAGDALEAVVNGVAVSPTYTHLGGGSSTTYTLTVNDGDTITFNLLGAGNAENAWQLRDATGAVVHTDGGSYGTGPNANGTAPAATSGPAAGFVATCPTCGNPSSLIANTISTDSAMLNWAPSATGGASYNWEVQPSGTAQGTAGSPAMGSTTLTAVST